MAGRCGCGRSCSCCSTTTPSVAVSGSGSAGQCYGYAVRYSSDSGNRARPGTDGAVLADLCLYAPNGLPLAVTEEGCATLPAACLLDYNGDPIAPTEEGCLQLPTAGPPPDFACGLRTNEDGDLTVDTSWTGGWPMQDLTAEDFDGAYGDAGGIFCDPDGQLRTLPDHTGVVLTQTDTLLDPTLQVVTTTYTSPASGTMTVVDPSPARRFVGLAFVVMTVDLVNPPNGGAEARLQTRVNGGAWSAGRALRWPEIAGGGDNVRTQQQINTRVSVALDPGQTWTLETRCQVAKLGAGGDPVVVSIESATRFLGWTV